MSDDFNMLMTNTFIALCKKIKGVPDSLRNLAYEIQGIESEFAIGDNKKCNPDMIVSSSQTMHTMILEFKSGANVPDEQKQKYSVINKDILLDYALMPIDHLDSFDIVYVCKEEHSQTIRQGLNETGFAILLKMVDRIEASAETTLKSNDTDTVFRPLIINWEQIPRSFYPFDKDCSNKLVATHVIQQVFEFMNAEKHGFIVDEVLEIVFPYWGKIGTHKKKELRQKAKKVIQKASIYEFNRFLQYNRQQSRGSGPKFDIISNPFIDVLDKPKIWKDMNKRLELFCARLEVGIEPEFDF